jgi:hypothetical protein
MKTPSIALITLLVNAALGFAAPPQSTESATSLNTTERLASGTLLLSSDSMAIFTAKTEPHERIALVFDKDLHPSSINRNGTCGYYLAVFDRSSGTWGKCCGGIGLPRLKPVPMSARNIHIEWTGGDRNGWWLNYEPDDATVELLPAEQFDQLFTKKPPKKRVARSRSI